MKSLVSALALVAAIPSAAAPFDVDGNQFTATFENEPLGATQSCDEGIGQCVDGGVVSAATGGFTAFSGSQFMLGTSIQSSLGDNAVTLWPAIGAWIQSGSVVNVTFYGGEQGNLQLLSTVQAGGSGAYEYVSAFSNFDLPLLEIRMTSDALFAVDNVTFGLPDVMVGVPEPASWALMIAGFGAIGLSARRRRPAAA